MFPLMLTLTLVAGTDPQPPVATQPKVQMPRLTDGPGLPKPLSALTSVARPVVTNAAQPLPPLNLPPLTRPGTAASSNRLPPFTGGLSPSPLNDARKVFDWHFGQIVDEENRSRFDRAVVAEQAKLGPGEKKEFDVRMFGDGLGRPLAFDRLLETRRTSVLSTAPPGFRLLTKPSRDVVTTGAVCVSRDGVYARDCDRLLLPARPSEDRFTQSRMARDVAAIKGMSVPQAELDRQRLGYDRVRSLLTPAGPDAVSSMRDVRPPAMPLPNATPHPTGRTVVPKSAPAWHPPMVLPKSTPLP